MRRRSAGASSASRARADGLRGRAAGAGAFADGLRAGRFFGGGFAAAGFFLGGDFAAAGLFFGAGFAAAGRFLGEDLAAGFAVLRVLRLGWGFALAIACAVRSDPLVCAKCGVAVSAVSVPMRASRRQRRAGLQSCAARAC